MTNLLTEEMKKQLLNKIDDIEVEVEELDSYEWDSNPYLVEPHLAYGSGYGVWNEDEEYNAKLGKLKQYIEDDGVWEYVDINEDDIEDEDKMNKLKKEVNDYIDSLERDL